MAPPQRFYSQCVVVVCRSHPLSVEELNELVEEALGGAKTSGLTAEYKVSSWSIAHHWLLSLYIVSFTFLYVDCATQLCPFSATVDS